MKINLEIIKELAKNINKHELSEVCLESNDIKIIMKKEKNNEVFIERQKAYLPVEDSIEIGNEILEKKDEVEEILLEAITSPMTGAFYSTPAPGVDVFVREGQEIKAGTTVCIIEAMKLMNEVKALKDCKIEKLLINDGTILKKGDKIFLIS